MAYSSITWQQFRRALYHRLGRYHFWTDDGINAPFEAGDSDLTEFLGVPIPNSSYPEVSGLLREALLAWGSLTYFWRDRITFTTTAGQAWYDLTIEKPEFFTGTLTVLDLIADMQHHFLEPINPSGTTDSGQVQRITERMQEALQRRQDQFLFETGLIRTRETLTGLTIPGNGRFQVATNIVDIRRLSWEDLASGKVTHLKRNDEAILSSYLPNWQAPAADPMTFSTTVTPSLRIQFGPPPANKGTLDMVSTKTGPTLDRTVGVKLGVPDSYVHVIKWGAMADLLSVEGEFRDPLRAEYCELRYKQGIELARMQPAILHAEILGRNLPITPLHDLDTYRSGWENDDTGKPTTLGTTGINLVTLSPIPDAAYTLTLDVVRPAPTPSIPFPNADFVDIGAEQIDALIDYAQHIASFKQGGLEFQMTGKQFGNMIEQAAKFNAKIRGNAVFAIPTFGKKQEDEARDIISDDQARGTLT